MEVSFSEGSTRYARRASSRRGTVLSMSAHSGLQNSKAVVHVTEQATQTTLGPPKHRAVQTFPCDVCHRTAQTEPDRRNKACQVDAELDPALVLGVRYSR
eukprot:RCo017124